MNEIFFTTGATDNPRQIDHISNISWDHKEKVIAQLMTLGVPLRPAELAAIDFKTILYACQHRKLSPEQTANMMIDVVRKAYFKNGQWAFSQ